MTIIFLTVSCSTPKNKTLNQTLSADEIEWMEKFFRDVMLEEGGIYTLCGSKPITLITISYDSDDEIQAYLAQLSEEEKEELHIDMDYNLPANWEKWEKIKARFTLEKYLFFKKKDPDDPNNAFIFLVDKLKTSNILRENYEDFVRFTGINFDPDQIVDEIQNEESTFWKRSFANAALIGLLFGYGHDNSWNFYWMYYDDSCKKKSPSSNFHFSDEMRRGKATLSDFPLPIFASFVDQNDPVIIKYRKEREEIQRLYNGVNFLDLTLQKLTVTPPLKKSVR